MSFNPPPLGTTVSGNAKIPIRNHQTSEDELPSQFVYHPEQLTPSRNQGNCGSCWAFAITSVMADIIKIKGGPTVPLSVENLLNCYSKNCKGQDIDDAIESLPLTAYIPESQSEYKQQLGGDVVGKCQLSAKSLLLKAFHIDGSGKD